MPINLARADTRAVQFSSGVQTNVNGQGFPFCYMCFKSVITSNSTTKWQQILVFCYHVLSTNDLQKKAELLVLTNTNTRCHDQLGKYWPFHNVLRGSAGQSGLRYGGERISHCRME